MLGRPCLWKKCFQHTKKVIFLLQCLQQSPSVKSWVIMFLCVAFFLVFSDSAFCRIYLFKITRDRQDHILYSKLNWKYHKDSVNLNEALNIMVKLWTNRQEKTYQADHGFSKFLRYSFHKDNVRKIILKISVL